MRTVLLVEDSFIESFELEYRLKELGYTVKIVATLEGARECLRQLHGSLAGIICDNRLISGEPVAARVYAYARSRTSSIPFVVYSAFPPRDLPEDDPLLAVVTKPFIDEVIKHLGRFVTGQRRAPRRAAPEREAA